MKKSKKNFRKDEKNILKVHLKQINMSKLILPCKTAKYLFNLEYILLTQKKRFCLVVFLNSGVSIASAGDKGKLTWQMTSYHTMKSPKISEKEKLVWPSSYISDSNMSLQW